MWFAFNSAYGKYVEEGDNYDWRSEKKKKKYGVKMFMRRKFPVLLLTPPQLH
jgi:hypothetical protein